MWKKQHLHKNKHEGKVNDSDSSSDEEEQEDKSDDINQSEIPPLVYESGDDENVDSGDNDIDIPKTTVAEDGMDKIRANIPNEVDNIEEDTITPQQMANPQGEDFQKRFLNFQLTKWYFSLELLLVLSKENFLRKHFLFTL